MKILRIENCAIYLSTVLLVLLCLAARSSFASCAGGAAAVKSACETVPSNTRVNQSSLDTQGEEDGIYEMSSALAATLESAAASNRSTASSCRQAGSSCLAACQAEAAAERAKKQSCSSSDDESSESCEAHNAACEAKAAELEAMGAQCMSSAESAASTFDSQATIFDSQAAQARKTAAAAKGQKSGLIPPKAAPPAQSLSSGGGGGDGKAPDNSHYSDRQCLTKSDAYKHESCTDRFVQKCKDNLADSRCRKFAEHYCAPPKPAEEKEDSTSTADADAEADSDEPAEKEDDYYRDPSAGVSTNFCQFALSSQYCATSGREKCPSCEGLSQIKTCKGELSKCLPQLSDSEKISARNACPTDPLFMNPSFNPMEPDPTEAETETEEPFVGDGTQLAVEIPSDIRPASSGSLFSAHSELIQKRCQQDAVNNCGP